MESFASWWHRYYEEFDAIYQEGFAIGCSNHRVGVERGLLGDRPEKIFTRADSQRAGYCDGWDSAQGELHEELDDFIEGALGGQAGFAADPDRTWGDPC